MSKFYELNHISPAHPLSRLFTSWLLPSPIFLVYRGLLCLYSVLVIILANSLHPSEAGTRFSYFTWLTYWGITFYLLFSFAHTFSYWKWGNAWLESWPRWLQFLHVLLYTTITILPWTVTAVYWALLFDGFGDDTYDAWQQISTHALNAVVAFLEIVIPRSEMPPWLHIPFLLVILLGYLGVAYITEATQGFYTYSFLNSEKQGVGITAAYCVGIMVGTIILFCLVKGLIWFRIWVTERRLGMTGKFSKRDFSGSVRGGAEKVTV